MRKKIEWQWEELSDGARRVKVIGGWIVNMHRRCDNGKLASFDQSSVFIPDRDHEWHILEPVKETASIQVSNKAADFEPK